MSKSAPIVVLSIEDIEDMGYNANLTEEQWNKVVRYMNKAYEFDMDIFWENLRYACSEAGIEKIKND